MNEHSRRSLSGIGSVRPVESESFFSSVKSEVADRFDSCGEAKMELFDYIEVFYNQRRRHSTLGQISPAAFERRATHAA
jgi:transposase InsO family protein